MKEKMTQDNSNNREIVERYVSVFSRIAIVRETDGYHNHFVYNMDEMRHEISDRIISSRSFIYNVKTKEGAIETGVFATLDNARQDVITRAREEGVALIGIDRFVEERYPNISAETMQTAYNLVKHDSQFKYQILDRMKQDCEYFLNAGNRHEKYLWAGNAREQIVYMKALYDSFTATDKPEWLSMEQIEGYEVVMTREYPDIISIPPGVSLALLNDKEPIASTGNADIYEIDDSTAIVTGNRPFGDVEADAAICRKYNFWATSLIKSENERKVLLENFVIDAVSPVVPYKQLDKSEKIFVDSLRESDAEFAALNGWGLDKLVDHPDWTVRFAVAARGYGLDKLIHDEQPTVRNFAKQRMFRERAFKKFEEGEHKRAHGNKIKKSPKTR